MNASIKCEIVRETEKALLVKQSRPNRDPVEAWIPRSQCDHISKRPEGEKVTATIKVASWIVDKAGLVEEA
jgi:hypothetical protein